ACAVSSASGAADADAAALGAGAVAGGAWATAYRPRNAAARNTAPRGSSRHAQRGPVVEACCMRGQKGTKFSGPPGRTAAAPGVSSEPGSSQALVTIGSESLRAREIAARRSDVQLLGFVSTVHDEVEARRRILAHQLVDDAVGFECVGDRDAEHAARLGV